MNIILAVVALGFGHSTPNIDDYAQTNLEDAVFVAHVVKGDQRELRKINDSFGQSYKFESTTIKYKDPFMLRLDATVDDTTITYVLNGARQAFKVPRMHLSKAEDISRSPGRRQTALDFGLIVPSLFKTFMTAQFVRMDRATGDPVFDVTYQDKGDTSRNRVWIDPQRHIIAKREWYNQSGRQLATFFYDEPKEENGVWLPTRLTVRNMDDMVAGVTRYDSIQVNAGIPSTEFSIDH
jgi:outer membrane lipoprotein-sorting protein